jgi:D-glycero-D-manno-heptose 1,7-bisphosphate phosphatase
VKAAKAIFLDRDGVINRDPDKWTQYSYVTDWKDFHFLPGALEALKMLKDHGVKVIIISNQAGVSKGYFTKERLDEITEKMRAEVEAAGGRIDDVYYCIHKSDDNCECRKPKTGLLEKAAKKHSIDCRGIYFIGDSRVDIIAGRIVGCRTVFVLSGKTGAEEMESWEEKPDYIFNNLLEAVKWIIKEEKY